MHLYFIGPDKCNWLYVINWDIFGCKILNCIIQISIAIYFTIVIWSINNLFENNIFLKQAVTEKIGQTDKSMGYS